MSTKMLIDARHPEETRVVVLRGSRVEDFDYESVEKQQLKGNIYLARVTRVEPSLQAAFVEYGGNRHGFLAFSEIHPDYYQIPIADREKLLREEAEQRAHHRDEEEPTPVAAETDAEHDPEDEVEVLPGADDTEDNGADEMERAAETRRRHRRSYKIQEVIKRRQVLLIQVVKEERGSKGAALTTYISLAGRYCVLMPNSTHGGGISRKIAATSDRRRLKTIMSDLEVPEGMGCIIRTAGMTRTKVEIKRDYDYLIRLWEDIRDLTLKSIAPALIHQEGDLIKRSIRDIYSREIDEVLVEGDESYRSAKNFMRMLMPSHAKKVQLYKDRIPLFQRYKIEAQLDTMFNPVVQLKSGGYIVINPTEALVSIDVNSGKATREHNIEETALVTNGEAAEEIARQLRLRDMAGLIVIDFIDMEDRGNNRTVERKLHAALKADRARVQIGRISSFGLLEMSRQRLRPGVLEASTHKCPICDGAGMVRSVSSAALHAIRALEEEGLRARASQVRLSLATDVAIYILNQKRDLLQELERRYGYRIEILASNTLIAPHYELAYSGPPPEIDLTQAVEPPLVEDDDLDVADEDEVEVVEGEVVVETVSRDPADEGEGGERNKKRRRRRRRRGGRRDEDGVSTAAPDHEAVDEAVEPGDAGDETPDGEAKAIVEGSEEEQQKRRRRSRRGGRGRRNRGDRERGHTDEPAEALEAVAGEPVAAEPMAEPEPAPQLEAAADEKPKRKPRSRAKPKPEAVAVEAVEAVVEAVETPIAKEIAPKPRRSRAKPKPVAAEPLAVASDQAPAPEAVQEPQSASEEAPALEPVSDRPPRQGWWQRAFNK